MSYVTPFFLGFFDHAAASRGELKVREPLDFDMSNRLLAESAERWERGFLYVGIDRFTVQEGYVQCWDAPHRPGADFMIEFARQTGCEIFNWDALVVESAQSFADYFDKVEQMRADRRERARRAKQQRI